MSQAVTGILIDNHSDDLIYACAFKFGCTLAFIVESSALHQGLLFVVQHNNKNIIIEGDDLLIINAVKGIWAPP